MTVPNSEWFDLGQCPTVAATAQPPDSRTIVQLQPYRGRIFLGYGEWSVGLDACDLIAWDPASAAYETVLAGVATDALWSLRVVDDALWALATDPAVGTNPDAVVVAGDSVIVLADAHVAPWHLFDVLGWNGATYLAGASRFSETESRAAVWRSAGNGAIWELVLDDATSERAFGLFILGDFLYAIGFSGATWWTGDGVAWRRMERRLLAHSSECTRPWTLGNLAIYVGGWNAYGGAPLYAFDGRREVVLVPDPVYDAFVDGTTLAVLTTGGEVWKTENLVDWEIEADGAPPEARSLCLAGGAIYLGTTDSRLWRWALG